MMRSLLFFLIAFAAISVFADEDYLKLPEDIQSAISPSGIDIISDSFDMANDQGMFLWNADSRNYLHCAKKISAIRIFCETGEAIGNLGIRAPFNIFEESGFGAKSWAIAAGSVIPGLGHLVGGALGLGMGAFKGLAEGVVYSYPALIEGPSIMEVPTGRERSKSVVTEQVLSPSYKAHTDEEKYQAGKVLLSIGDAFSAKERAIARAKNLVLATQQRGR
ncbi:hypothetical protein [Candidatus Nitrosacidococcus tergens]|uniref:Uncharacterized protein n=1 Tax=Candidatus Nitrosacidococcus tergens TaxID=553981 RepID=A0A7G1QBK3_9GAMM|nr:hypothetical protein [Candidatus Nitrosacidococcus tergens]CAB1277477.1 conserved exported protein of unknown function [Candidatus Nitrosacidococcus tergens]